VTSWIRRANDGTYRSAQLRHYPASAKTPAIAPEIAVIQFCQQLDVEPRLFFDALGAAAQYTGPLP